MILFQSMEKGSINWRTEEVRGRPDSPLVRVRGVVGIDSLVDYIWRSDRLDSQTRNQTIAFIDEGTEAVMSIMKSGGIIDLSGRFHKPLDSISALEGEELRRRLNKDVVLYLHTAKQKKGIELAGVSNISKRLSLVIIDKAAEESLAYRVYRSGTGVHFNFIRGDNRNIYTSHLEDALRGVVDNFMPESPKVVSSATVIAQVLFDIANVWGMGEQPNH